MGKTKHGKDSAKAKKNNLYKTEGRHAINKAARAAKIASGKKIKKKGVKTVLMKWNTLLRNTPISKPYTDADGRVYWGIEKDGGEEKVRKMLNKSSSKKRKNIEPVEYTEPVE